MCLALALDLIGWKRCNAVHVRANLLQGAELLESLFKMIGCRNALQTVTMLPESSMRLRCTGYDGTTHLSQLKQPANDGVCLVESATDPQVQVEGDVHAVATNQGE